MSAKWMIQVVEEFAQLREANMCLDALRGQDGFLGGRLLDPSPAKPDWRVQAFFQDEPEAAEFPEHLPDGCRRVLVPYALRARLGIGS